MPQSDSFDHFIYIVAVPLDSLRYEEGIKMIEKLAKESVKNIPPYIPGKNPDEVENKGAEEIYKLSSNENQLGPSPKAIEALIRSASNSHLYPDFFAIDLRSKIAEKFGFGKENVITACGSSMILELLGQVFVKPKDEVIFCVPTFMLYASIATGNEGIPVMLPLNDKLEYDLEAMLKAINEKTKMVMICNPNNPTGTALSGKQIREFIGKVPDHILVVVDEAYIEFADRPDVETMLPLVKEKENVIILRTFSKIYGLAGLRVGYGIASPEMIDLLSRKLPAFNTNKAAVEAAKASLEDEEFLEKSYQMILEGRKYLEEEFEKLGFTVYESQTNFIYVDTHVNPNIVSEELEKKGIIIRGNFAFTRITIGTMEQNQKIIKCMKEFVRQQGSCQ